MKLTKENIDTIDDNLLGVYLIKNIVNNKYYIGQSIVLKRRLNDHIKYSKIKSKMNSYPIYKAINKYNINNFEFKILYSAEKNNIGEQRDLLNQLEEKYIIEYNSYGSTGYNQTLGSNNETGKGTLGYKFTEEQKENLSNIQKNLSDDRYDPYYVYEISTKKCLKFFNGSILRKYTNTEREIQIRRTDWKKTNQGFAIFKDDYLIAGSKEDLKEQLINYKSRHGHNNESQFKSVNQNIYCYNYILKCYYTLYCLKETSELLNKTPQNISNTIANKSRTDDGWIVSKNKTDLELIKKEKYPSKKTLSRYKHAIIKEIRYPKLKIEIIFKLK